MAEKGVIEFTSIDAVDIFNSIMQYIHLYGSDISVMLEVTANLIHITPIKNGAVMGDTTSFMRTPLPQTQTPKEG